MNAKPKILFVDDEKHILFALRAVFRSQYEVFTANSGAEALDILSKEHIHAIISDQRMPQMAGHELLREVKVRYPNTMRLLLTGYSDIPAILNSINEGEVFRFINKPWKNEEIRSTIDSAVQIALNTLGSAPRYPEENQASTPETSGVGILVIDQSPSLVDMIKASFPQHAVHVAQSIELAMDVLARQEIAVLIADLSVKGEDTTEFIKLLKQQYPLIMSIVLTDILDADAAIDLINQGQIFRYIRKTSSKAVLGMGIKHALYFYARNKSKPELLQRYKVEALKEIRNPSLAERLLGRLKSLRSRFSFGFARS